MHALLGENGAGKSTFIQILAGSIRPDAGSIRLDGVAYRAKNPRQAHAAGISAVFQELSLIPDLSVAQNVWFRREPLSPLGMLQRRALRRKTQQLFERHRVPAPPPDREVRRLTLAERQVVEIAKALARKSSILILDEATSALPPAETEWLLGLTPRRRRYARHLYFAPYRRGAAGGRPDYRVPQWRNSVGAPDRRGRRRRNYRGHARAAARSALSGTPDTATKQPALPRPVASAWGSLREIDWPCSKARSGCRRPPGARPARALRQRYGLVRPRGELQLWGKPATIRSPRQALKNFGVAMVPEDRRGQGLLLAKSVRENLTLSVIRRFSRSAC